MQIVPYWQDITIAQIYAYKHVQRSYGFWYEFSFY